MNKEIKYYSFKNGYENLSKKDAREFRAWLMDIAGWKNIGTFYVKMKSWIIPHYLYELICEKFEKYGIIDPWTVETHN